MRVSVLAFVTLAIAVSGGAGCKRKPPPPTTRYVAPVASAPAPPSSAPAGHFDGTKLVLDGHPDWTCTLHYGYDGSIDCSAVGTVHWPAGTKLVYGAEESDLADYATAKIKAPYAVYGAIPIAARSLDDVGLGDMNDATVHPQGKLVFRFSNGVESSVELPEGKLNHTLAEKIMTWAADHPLTFEGEGKHEGPHTVFWLQRGSASNVVGSGKHLAEADWIAVTTTSTTQNGVSCAYQGGVHYPLEIESWTVKIVDRKTNGEIQSKTFTPTSPACPMFAVYQHANVFPELKTVGAWIQSVAKSHP